MSVVTPLREIKTQAYSQMSTETIDFFLFHENMKENWKKIVARRHLYVPISYSVWLEHNSRRNFDLNKNCIICLLQVDHSNFFSSLFSYKCFEITIWQCKIKR